jgi:metallophosphoesterase (TIGR00282 family)
MNLLFIGDVVGKGGRAAVKELVPELRKKYNCSFIIANVENVAGGAGISASCLTDFSGVVDVYTSGDHVWDQKGFEEEIKRLSNFLRPANYNRKQPGKGYEVFRNPASGELAVINLLGKVFMKESSNCPFETVETILSALPPAVKTIIVDIHAEATSEKAAMAHFLDGRVTAVVGTHTHVQTADACILPKGTAFISDVGMTGSVNSILGRDIESVLRKFTSGMPQKLPVVEKDIRLDAVVISYDMNTGKASEIKNISVKAGF